MKYIVTGGAGFIGSHLAESLFLQGHDVCIIDDLSSGNIENISHLLEPKKMSFVRGSITDKEILQKQFSGADGVFHQAAFISVPRSIEDPLLNHTININGTLNVLLAARDAGVRKVVYASSAAVYGNLPDLPKREDTNVDPQSPYAVAKLTGEYYCSLFTSLYGLKTVCLRYFNVYGPRQDPHSDYAAVIPKFIHKVKQGKPPVIYGDGEQTRDFIFVKDVVRVNLRAMESEAIGVFNVANGEETSVNELAYTVLSLSKSSLKPHHEKGRQGEVKHSVADISKVTERLGITPEYDLSRGLSEMIRGDAEK
ncbi:MAG: UDP-glucose 4-epimerase [Bacteroidetes bacterium ADurb.Bin123]|nr:MAG: UDP-glucose 4-epimerase [Bacteroidetes bacterium ADurb.Bin123]